MPTLVLARACWPGLTWRFAPLQRLQRKISGLFVTSQRGDQERSALDGVLDAALDLCHECRRAVFVSGTSISLAEYERDVNSSLVGLMPAERPVRLFPGHHLHGDELHAVLVRRFPALQQCARQEREVLCTLLAGRPGFVGRLVHAAHFADAVVAVDEMASVLSEMVKRAITKFTEDPSGAEDRLIQVIYS